MQMTKAEVAWANLEEKHKLNAEQLEQFKKYAQMLVQWNENMNLTTIVEPEQIIKDHFMDSLELENIKDISQLTMIGDIGTGAGFPGIPLKIKYPHLKLVLIEVVGKKIAFLREVIKELALENVEQYTLDWRTFLRKTTFPIDLFVTRASIQLSELFRMYKPSSPYKNLQVVYWASKLWQPAEDEKPFIKQDHPYQIGYKKRNLIVFGS